MCRRRGCAWCGQSCRPGASLAACMGRKSTAGCLRMWLHCMCVLGRYASSGGPLMRPAASSASVRSRMSRQRRRDTQPELLVRQILHSRAVRYRVNTAPEPGMRCKPDIVWRGLRLAVFMDGCFWHGCPVHATSPKANKAWWARKLDDNVQRDLRTNSDLAARGWTVLRFWEHEQPGDVADTICVALDELRRAM